MDYNQIYFFYPKTPYKLPYSFKIDFIELFIDSIELINMSSNKIHCDCCNRDYVKSYYKKHLVSKKHLKNQRKQQTIDNQKIIDDIITIPTDIMDIIVGYKNDLENYSDINNFFDRVEEGINRCGNKLSINYTLKDTMKHSELLEMIHQVFSEDECLILNGLTGQQIEETDPEYHIEISEIFFQYNKNAGENKYYFSLE